MNTFLNYIIEANIALLLFLAVYKLLFARETHFSALRLILLAGIVLSISLPLIHFEGSSPEPALSIGQVIPSYWLPEVSLGDGQGSEATSPAHNIWQYIAAVYFAGCAVFLVAVLIQLARLLLIIRQAKLSRAGNLWLAESEADLPVFSFCNFIVVGKAHELSAEDRDQILLHESAHARRWHSLDILLIHLLQIVFWFNPFILTYKKIFIQLHEFEADARAVENCDANRYCSLLARVALQSADFRLAHYFNNSLTIKRIEMIRTIKRNIRHWKLTAMAMSFPLVFFFVACQDQVMDDMQEITRNSSHALIVPEFIQARFGEVQKKNPGKKYALLELNETASQKLEELKTQFGVPKSIEIHKTVDGKPVSTSVVGHANDVIFEPGTTDKAKGRNSTQTFAIVEFNETASQLSEAAGQEEKIFTVVEEQPEFPGGYDSLRSFLRRNLRYPSDARQQGIQGTVYVSFIVNEDGSVTNATLIRSISPSADAEAKRVVEMFPNWKPGRQSGRDVKVRFVIPIKFAL